MSDKCITLAAAKTVYKQMVRDPELSALEIINQYDMWLSDEWTHVGLCILVCLQNSKLVDSFKKNSKILDSLLGKVIKLSNSSVDPELVRELLPLIIERHFS